MTFLRLLRYGDGIVWSIADWAFIVGTAVILAACCALVLNSTTGGMMPENGDDRRVGMTEGVRRIMHERGRQLYVKGWTAEHDRSQRADGALLDFALAILLNWRGREVEADDVASESADWVDGAFRHALDKYNNTPEYVRLLDIAGGLIAAEVDRIVGGAS